MKKKNEQNVFARKYRPTKLSEVIGQQSVVTILSNAIQSNNLHHAYLFYGVRGVGKTTVARILAAMVNCEKGLTIDPCGKCFHCNAIFAGKHSDVEEIDTASSGKIDQMRELKKTIYYAPIAGARKKMYILDEFHRATKEAEDCLLKTLEEPPAHVIFSLCTTDFQKMTPTIISRCQCHHFQKVYWTQIQEHLLYICKKEKIDIETEAVRSCANLGRGSVRDALQFLEKLVDYAGGEPITTQMAHDVFGAVKEDVYFKLLSCIMNDKKKPDITEGYQLINDILVSNSNDVDVFLNGLDEHLRALLVTLTSTKAAEFLPYTEDEKKRIILEASRFNIPQINGISKLTNEIHKWLTYNVPVDKLLDQWLVDSILLCHWREEKCDLKLRRT